jgi:hypothetical protein
MISLNDDELQILLTAARPIPAQHRSDFLNDVASELSKYPEIGPGVIHRVTAKIQRQHLAPRMSHNVGSKYGH